MNRYLGEIKSEEKDTDEEKIRAAKKAVRKLKFSLPANNTKRSDA